MEERAQGESWQPGMEGQALERETRESLQGMEMRCQTALLPGIHN